jgi:hypothetical protein
MLNYRGRRIRNRLLETGCPPAGCSFFCCYSLFMTSMQKALLHLSSDKFILKKIKYENKHEVVNCNFNRISTGRLPGKA